MSITVPEEVTFFWDHNRSFDDNGENGDEDEDEVYNGDGGRVAGRLVGTEPYLEPFFFGRSTKAPPTVIAPTRALKTPPFRPRFTAQTSRELPPTLPEPLPSLPDLIPQQVLP